MLCLNCPWALLWSEAEPFTPNFRLIFFAASCTASWVGQALSSVKSAGKACSDICQQQAKNTINWATGLPCHTAQERWRSQGPKLLLSLCCRGTHGGDVQWSLTNFMVCETFPVTTLGEQPSPTGSVQMYKNKLIFKLSCPNSACCHFQLCWMWDHYMELWYC